MISCEKIDTKFKIMKTPLEKLLGIITLKIKDNAIYLMPIIDKVDVDNYRREEQLIIDGVINWVAVSDSLPDHLEKVVMYGKRTEHNEYEIITGVLNKAGGLNDWNTYGIVMHKVTHWAKIKPPCL